MFCVRQGITEVERALTRRKGLPLIQELTDDGNVADISEAKPSMKDFNFMDERIMNGNWVEEPHATVIQNFLRLPDEATFIISAKELGFAFYERTQTSISLREFDSISGRIIRSVKFERLAKNGREFEKKTKKDINEYVDAGLRTLILAYRELDEEEYTLFNKELMEAKSLVSADREKIVKDILALLQKTQITMVEKDI